MYPESRFKKFLFWFFIIFILFISVGVYISFKYADKIEKLVIEELNKNLNRPITINDVEFSLFSKFPKASVKITQVNIEGIKKEDEAFIQAKSIYFSFDFMSLFGDEILINQIDIEDGEINISVDKKGNGNYNILKQTKKDNQNESILKIEEISLINVAIKYDNQQQKQLHKLFSDDTELSFNMGETQQFVVANFDGKIRQVKIPGYSFKKEVTSSGDLELIIDTKGVKYLFKNGEINGQNIFVEGFYQNQGRNALSFKLKDADLDKITPFFPQNDDKTWASYKMEGDITIKGKLNTSLQGKTSLNADFNLKNGQFVVNPDSKISDITFSGNFQQSSISNLNTAVITCDNFSFKLGNNALSGKGKVTQLSSLLIDAEIKGRLDMVSLVDAFAKDKLLSPTGTIQLNTKINGRLMDIIQNKNLESFTQIKTEGDIEIIDFGFVIPNQKNSYQNISGKINFNNQNIQLIDFKGKINSTDFTLNGKINDYALALLNNAPLDISATVSANKFIMEEFINDEKKSSKNDDVYDFNLPEKLKLNLNINLESFAFRAFSATNIKGKVSLNRQVLVFENLDFNSSDGLVNLKGKIASLPSKNIIYEGQMNLKGLNLKKLFTEMENFGQGFLLAKHLKGNLESDIYFLAESDSALNINQEKIYCKAGIKIKNGELNQFEPMIDLQKFLQSEFKVSLSLEDLKFSTLENNIEIVNRKIYIPEMKIASSGINLEVSGIHSFDQEINYLFKVKSNEVFKAKNNNQIDQKYGVVENNDRTATLPILMTGTVDNPKFSYDIKTKKVIVQENLQQEKKEIKNAFKQELNEILGKKDSVSVKKQKENKTTIKVEWEE